MDVVARLSEFDPHEHLPQDAFFIIFYGLRRCGKTTMLRYLLYSLEPFLVDHELFLFSSTAEVSPEEYNFVPPRAKFHNISELENDLRRILGKQKLAIKDYHEGKGEKPSPILMILDDVVSENIVRHSPSLNTLAVAGRHMNISVVLLSQVVTGSGSVPPIIRTQCDVIFVVANPRSEVERKLLIEQYLSPTNAYNIKSKAQDVLEAATSEQFRALVILTTDSSARNFEDYLLLYGPVPPEIPENFRLGTDEQWDMSATPVVRKHTKPIDIKKTDSKTVLNPFRHTPDLPKQGNEYLRGTSDSLNKLPLGRRRK